MNIDRFWAGALAVYLFLAVVVGNAMGAVIPALNPLGRVYVGLTWPVAVSCVALRAECSAVPPQRYASYLFTFDEDEAE